MKRDTYNLIPYGADHHFKWMSLLMISFLLLCVQPLMAQDTTAVEEEEEDVTIKSRMTLTGSQYPDGTIELNGLLRARIEGSYEKVPNQKVSFFSLNDEADETALGEGNTGVDGVARYKFNTEDKSVNADGNYSFIARYDGDERMNGSESELHLRPAKLIMEPIEADSTYTLKFQAVAMSAEGPQPIAEATVAVYIKRMFSLLKVVEGETDEEGIVELEFPLGLSGDQEGNLEISARIEETEEYGNLEAAMTQKWGKAVSHEAKELPNALWSSHPPVWMIVTFFILMGTVWIHYMIIIFNLFSIRSEKDESAA